MTDLRTRIAYAIAQADGDEPGMEPASCDYEMADAVIAELKLEKQTLNREMWAAAPNVHRYTTPWKDNE
jgi:hypothetical protein